MSEESNGVRPATVACPTAGEGADGETLQLVVYHKGEAPTVKIVPAGRWRDWMNATSERFANRCLPLLMANQSGWVLLNPAPFTATWDGGNGKSCMTIEYPPDTTEELQIAVSQFGYGILTFRFQDVVTTPPGYNLFARGPTNTPKDGGCGLDGLIETDWPTAPFTMNWKLTRPGALSFGEDEPFCHITPQRRGELERFRPQFRSLDSRPELAARASAWAACRGMVIAGQESSKRAGEEAWRRFWLQDYFRGRTPTGESSPEHQTTLRLTPFADCADNRAATQGSPGSGEN